MPCVDSSSFFVLAGRSRRGRAAGQTWDNSGKKSFHHLSQLGCDLWKHLLTIIFISVELSLCISLTRMYRRLWPALAFRYVDYDLQFNDSVKCLL